ncbi:hypothetical protein Q8F55_003695 [Vanrija albida]|uniref:Zn(2)-C6 fungal-type domain-containing protein n=1 Tax=Vanrija albida TaxID=181172 RepID=A0ABR3Q4P1_9TREE
MDTSPSSIFPIISPGTADALATDLGASSAPSNGLGKRRKSSSGAQQPSARPSVAHSTTTTQTTSPEMPLDGDDEAESSTDRKKPRGSANAQVLTSCEACRKGKRRCEPSPLVPPDHPDVAKLPCARCRRFALDCVRMRVSRRKGPAPVDLSAISDAAHGYNPGTSGESASEAPKGLPASSTGSSGLDFDVGQGVAIPSPSFPLLAASPNVGSMGTAVPTSLDQVVSPPVLENIIGLFFDYVYPLTPCLHRPTFIADLAARRDKTDPVFFALTLVVLASTLVQVPRILVNLDKQEVEALARRCVRVARAKTAYLWEDPVPVRAEFVVIFYLEGIVHLLLGNNTAHVIVTAQANQCALALRLNEESSYEGLNPIESEIRRRIYWLLFQADKSTACLRARTICLRLEDAPGLRLPSEVDDEQITPAGVLPQPSGRTPLIAGFNIVTNLFRILNDALLLQRRKSLPSVDSILADLQNVNELRERVINATVEVASPLRIRSAYDSRAASPAKGWEANLQARFLDFFSGATDNDHINSFMVMQGNILVTQQVVRLVLLQTRESLLRQLAALTHMPLQSVGGLAGVQNNEVAEDIACDLLDGLNSLPEECVATNGPSLVQKVRFVAIQLMEGSTSTSPQAVRAQTLLMQFLSVLSVIEGMYTFGRDVSAE